MVRDDPISGEIGYGGADRAGVPNLRGTIQSLGEIGYEGGSDRAGVPNLRGGRGCRGSILRSRRWPLFENTNSRGGAVSLYLQAEIRILLVDIKENFYASFRYQ